MLTQMPAVLVVGVSYNSDAETLDWLAGVERAPERDRIQVIIVDNTLRDSYETFFNALQAVSPTVQMLTTRKNLGYFGGADFGWEQWRKHHSALPRWTIVSNVDVTFAPTFFDRLLRSQFPPRTGAIAPSIVSRGRHGDWNPKISRRPARWRMWSYTVLFRYRWLLNLYEAAARLKYSLTAKLRKPHAWPAPQSKEIYAPHGACIIFTEEYFAAGGDLRYPGFLFGEEVFVAETARQLGLKVIYEPALQVGSDDHVSTGRVRSPVIARYMYESAVLLARRYFSS